MLLMKPPVYFLHRRRPHYRATHKYLRNAPNLAGTDDDGMRWLVSPPTIPTLATGNGDGDGKSSFPDGTTQVLELGLRTYLPFFFVASFHLHKPGL